ncbi:MAG: hypothetical protein WA484_08005 [Solirubrobacteraceae bacterium]
MKAARSHTASAALRPALVVTLVLSATVLAAPVASARAEKLDITPDAGLRASALVQASYIAGRVGFPLKLKLAVGWADHPGEVEFAETNVRDKQNGPFVQHGHVCQIAVNKAWLATQSQPTAEGEVLIHEVFHCYEHQIAPAMATTMNEPNEHDWIVEGLARWVDLTFYPATPLSRPLEAIDTYIKTPSTGLFNRKYDAVGFWGHLQDVTGALWSRIPAIVRDGVSFHDQSAFNAAIGSDETNVLDSWGSSMLNISGAPAPWRADSPLTGGLGSSYPSGAATKIGAPAGVVLQPTTTAQFEVEPNPLQPLIEIHLGPGVFGRFGVHENYTNAQLKGKVFCAGTGCSSPAASCGGGAPSTLPPLTPLPSEPMLGLATGLSKGAADVSYFAAQNSSFCPESKGTPGGGTTGTTGGDPHLFSFGNQAFDFQAAGEFTLVKSTNSHDLEVQVREQPVPHSHSLAYNSAAAMRVGSAIFEVELTNGLSLNLYVNHHTTHSKSGKLSGGGSFSSTEQTVKGGYHIVTLTVRWKDGTTATAKTLLGLRAQGRYTPWLLVSVKLAHARLGHITGLLGNAGASQASEFESRKGTRYSARAIEAGPFDPADHKILYQEFGGSWRITQKESLFTYARHKSTSSYTISGYPEQSFFVGSVSPATAQQATATCVAQGITNRALLNDCEYDVAATGENIYASGDAQLQEVAGAGPPLYEPPNEPAPTPGPGPTGPAPPPPPPNPGIDLGSGSAHPSIAYDPVSGETYVAWQDPASFDVVDLCAVPAGAATCNGGAGPYKLTDPLASKAPAEPAYFAAKVLVQPSGTVVVLTNVDGANKEVRPTGYAFANGVIAWSSPAGGAAFATPGQGLENGGKLLAESQGAGDMPAGGAVALDATHILTYGDSYPFGSGATDFTLSSPAPSATPVVDKSGTFAEQFADGAQIASAPDAKLPGQFIAVAVGGSAKGCSGEEETGFSFVVGTPTALQSATWPAFKGIACQARSPVLAGGGPGGGAIGVIDAEGPGLEGAGSDGVYWRAFDGTTHTFTAPVPISDETAVTLNGPSGLSASSDAAGGLYAAWSDSRGVVLDYSNTAGSSWQPPRATGIQGGGPVVAGASAGHAQVAYTYESQEYLDPAA